MAVIDDLPGVKVEITIEDNSLAEHVENGLVEDERTLTRYIEAVSDQQFEVYIELLPNFDYKGDCIAFVVTVDGKQTDALMLSKTSGFRSIKSKGVEVAGGLIHKYRFADLETVNGDAVSQDEVKKANELGTVTIACVHITLWEAADFMDRTVGTNHIVSEKALKGQDTTHNVELMDPEQLPYGQSPFFDTLPMEEAACFLFRYRSLAALKSAGIIPRTPSPPPPTPLEDRDAETLSMDEIKELQKRALAFKESGVKIKRERGDDNPRGRKAARPSRGATQLELDEEGRVREGSTPTLAEIEVIELD